MGHQRLRPQPGRLDSAQRQPRRPLRAQTLLCGRHGRVRGWIGGVRAVRICSGAHRRTGASRCGGCHHVCAGAVHPERDVLRKGPGRRDRNLGDGGRSRLRPGPSRRRPPARGVRMVVHLLGQRAVRPGRHRPDRHRGGRITKSRYPPGGRSRRPHQCRGPARPDLRPHRVGLELLDVGPGGGIARRGPGAAGFIRVVGTPGTGPDDPASGGEAAQLHHLVRRLPALLRVADRGVFLPHAALPGR